MASPSAPTIDPSAAAASGIGAPAPLERPAEPPAPQPMPVRRDSFPDVALGISRSNEGTEPTSAQEDAGAGQSTNGGADAAGKDASTESGITAGSVTQKAENSPTGDLDWDTIKQRPEYQRDLATALNKQHEKLKREIKQELDEADRVRKQLQEMQAQQDEYDRLLELANNEEDPIQAAKAQQKLAEHAKATRLTEKVTSQLMPALEKTASAAIVARLKEQYDRGYSAIEGVIGKDAVAAIRHENFEDGGEWLHSLVENVYALGGQNAVAAFKKGDMEKEIKARVAEEVGRMRAGIRTGVDISDGVHGGSVSQGYSNEQDVHNAIAAGEISAARGRAILKAQFGRRF